MTSVRRSQYTWLVATAVAASLLAAACNKDEKRQMTNVPTFTNLVIVLVDALRSDHLPTYGYRRDTAPFVSQLARDGITLQGYSASSWTRTSVASLLTGLYPQRHQTVTRADSLPERIGYLPELLNDQGYTTVGFAANATVSDKYGFARGYDRFKSHRGDKHDFPPAAEVTGRTLELLDGVRSPFFLYVHYLDPHDPYIPQQPWGGGFDSSQYVQPDEFRKGLARLGSNTTGRMVDQYDGTIVEVDAAVAGLIQGLDQKGLLDETLVLFTADHGEEFMDHGGLVHGATLYEEVIRVPLILWARRGLSPYRSSVPFHHVDLLPTALQGLGLEPPSDLDGQARWKEVVRSELDRKNLEHLFFLDLGRHAELAMARPPYKLIHQRRQPTTRLYDIARDPGERDDLDDAALRAQLLKELVERHNALSAQAAQRAVTKVDHDSRKQLAALGYLEMDTPQEELEYRGIPTQLQFHGARRDGLFAGVVRSELSAAVDLKEVSPQLLAGWSRRPSGEGRTARGSARVALLSPKGATQVVVSGSVSSGSYRCELKVDGDELGTFDLDYGPFRVALPLGQPMPEERLVYVALKTSKRAPHQPDRRPLAGLEWYRIALE